MKNLKKSEPLDRLSELPDSIIFEIFWFLPMNEVVRTAILSKRWRNLWTATPYLTFYSQDSKETDYTRRRFRHPHNYSTDKDRNFFNRALLRWNGARVLRFCIDWEHDLDKSVFSDIDLWMSFAKEKEAEELYLILTDKRISSNGYYIDGRKEEVYWVPQFLYSLSSFKELEFKHCNFEIKRKVEWNQLKTLRIEGFEVTGDVINQILSGSPLLEVLVLYFAEIGCNYSIRSSSLKELSIYKHFNERNLFMDTELRIWTPNLTSLEITGLPYGKCLLMDVPSLTHATLGISGLHYFDSSLHNFPGIDIDNGLLSTNDFLGDKYSRILPSIQHAENITLFYCCIKVLGAMQKRCTCSSFPNVKSLQIGYRFNEYEQLASLLEIFPQLNRLVLQDREEDEFHAEPFQEIVKFDTKSDLKFETKFPESFLLHLRTVEVTWHEDRNDNIFPLIELLLKHASMLETMVFRVKKLQERHNWPASNSLFLVSQKLLRMPRSSPTAQLIVSEI